MGKCPHIQLYVDDYLGGTMGFTVEQHGAYLLALFYQSKNGPFTAAQIVKIIGPENWADVKHKFKQKNGEFFNARMTKEIIKRQQYSESRASNRRNKNKLQKKDMKNICKTYVKHMGNGNGNGNSSLKTKNRKEDTYTSGDNNALPDIIGDVFP